MMRRDQILKICREFEPPPTNWRGGKKRGGNRTEEEFVRKAVAKGADVVRHGWPDYLLELDGKIFGVEVKHDPDVISERQARNFSKLEKAGLEVFVWNPKRPRQLTPWRKYFSAQRRADRSPADARIRDESAD